MAHDRLRQGAGIPELTMEFLAGTRLDVGDAWSERPDNGDQAAEDCGGFAAIAKGSDGNNAVTCQPSLRELSRCRAVRRTNQGTAKDSRFGYERIRSPPSASNTSSTLMQSGVAPRRITRTRGPGGAHIAGSVGPNRSTQGRPTAAAR